LIAATVFVASMLMNSACLLRQVLIEAEGESVAGKAAVAEVIRERSRRSGLGYCAVIAQPGQFGTRTIDPPPDVIFEAIVAMHSEPPCTGVHFDIRGNSWARKMKVACIVGNHVVYENPKWN